LQLTTTKIEHPNATEEDFIEFKEPHAKRYGELIDFTEKEIYARLMNEFG
jgi:hypothetical protein